jgi:hypothetical protein
MSGTPTAVGNIKVNINGQEYNFEDLPKNAQLLLQDLMRMDTEMNELQYRLRQLQAAKQVYLSSLQQTMSDENKTDPITGAELSQDVGSFA